MWHKSGVTSPATGRRAKPPLDEAALQELALRYVGKYATTRAKLRSYLARKVRERGWNGERDPDFEALARRFAELGYIDDAGLCAGQSRSLSARGYGKRRLVQKLRVAGVDGGDSDAASAHADQHAVDAALRFAERRRIGPFANSPADRPQREKCDRARWSAQAIILRLRGRSPHLNLRQVIDVEQLFDVAGLTDA